MVTPGWYPDPSGTPGQLRWWDGSSWTQEVRGATAPSRRGGATVVALVAAGLVVVVAAWWFLLRPASSLLRGGAPPPRLGPVPTASPTISGWDEVEPSPGASGSPTPFDCTPIQEERGQQPADGLLHGGGLRVPVADGFRPTSTGFFAWADDEAAAIKDAGGSWVSFTGVAAVPTETFENPERASMLLWECHTVAGTFSGRTYDRELASEAVTIDGHPGWWRRVEVGSTAAPGGGARFDFVVVDVGDPDRLGFYWAGVTLNDTAALGATDAAREQLRADR